MKVRLHAVLASLLAVAACAPAAPRGESTLVVGRPADAIVLDPARVTDAESAEACEQIFEHLTRFKENSMDVEPALAESWSVSPDGRDWTFHLRPGVRFHDGTPMNADAVVFSFERQRDPRHPQHRNDFAYWESTFKNIEHIDKVDDLTVRISIERAYAPFLADLSMFPVAIVSPTAVKKWGDAFGEHPVGTGPFRFVEWSRGERITLEANADYWGGRPTIDRLVFAAIPNPRQRLVELEGGAIDVAEALAPRDLQFVALHPQLKTDRSPGNNVGYLAMNCTHPPFDDVRVRRAVNHAINRVPIVKLIYQVMAQPATGPLPPTTWGRADIPPYAYDPAKARALLAEAHYDHALHPKLYVGTTSALMPAPVEAARLIASNLHAVGMDVEIVANPFDKHIAATSAGEHDLALLGWAGDNGDPDNFLYELFDADGAVVPTATNVSFLRDPQLNGILRWAQETIDRPERERYYAQAQQIIHDEAPWVPLAHTDVVVALRSDVSGVVVHPSAVLYLRHARLERPTP